MKIDEEKANECLCLWSQHIFFKELFNIISLFYFFTLPVVRVHRIILIPVYHLLIIQHNKRTTTNHETNPEHHDNHHPFKSYSSNYQNGVKSCYFNIRIFLVTSTFSNFCLVYILF